MLKTLFSGTFSLYFPYLFFLLPQNKKNYLNRFFDPSGTFISTGIVLQNEEYCDKELIKKPTGNHPKLNICPHATHLKRKAQLCEGRKKCKDNSIHK